LGQCAVIRADGSAELGHGHVFRTLVLAEELRDRGWMVVYACRDLPGAPLDRIRKAGYGLELLAVDLAEMDDAAATAQMAREAGAAWVVVDRYASDERAHSVWANSGLKVLAVDDLAAHPFEVDVLINQNINAGELAYRTRQDTVRLFGPRYAMIRRAYADARPSAPRAPAAVRRVMIFMGGGDSQGAAFVVLEALRSVSTPLAVDLIVGSACPHLEALRGAAGMSPHSVTVMCDLADLVAPMSRADVAITSGGSVTWELCCLGVPMLLLPIADNQVGNAREMARIGAAIGLEDQLGGPDDALAGSMSAALSDIERLRAIGSQAWAMVDGKGCKRVVQELSGLWRCGLARGPM